MRRLTLILSDLYLPEEAAGSGGRGRAAAESFLAAAFLHALPSASMTGAGGCCASWIFPTCRTLPWPTHRGARLSLDPGRDAATWLATTRALVRAPGPRTPRRARGLLRLDADEAAAFCAEFAMQFAPHSNCTRPGERNFLLTGLEPRFARTVDPARLLGADIGGALPDGGAAPSLRRLGAEIEMWLHASALNVARERRRQAADLDVVALGRRAAAGELRIPGCLRKWHRPGCTVRMSSCTGLRP
jgi:hypothetical protein